MSFQSRMERRIGQLVAGVNLGAQKTAEAVLKNVVPATPIDTGKARINWQVTLNTPASNELTKPATPDSAADLAIAKGMSNLARSKPGDTIWFANNAKHIAELNNGKSSQAPAMFIEQAVSAAIVEMKKIRVFKG